jgi:hypothetical protein
MWQVCSGGVCNDIFYVKLRKSETWIIPFVAVNQSQKSPLVRYLNTNTFYVYQLGTPEERKGPVRC